ncbi:hypothetical protein LCGC14_2909030, partial [marine sediment metagenome]
QAEDSDVLVDEDEAETVIVVREIRRDISRQLQDAAGAEDTMRVVLEEVYPDLVPTLDRLVGSWRGVASNKDRIIARRDNTILIITERRDKWKESSGKQEERAIAAETGWATEKELTAALVDIFAAGGVAAEGAQEGA